MELYQARCQRFPAKCMSTLYSCPLRRLECSDGMLTRTSTRSPTSVSVNGHAHR